MHYQEHMSAYMHHIHIHGQHTHTCTTKYHQNGRCVNTCTTTNICATSNTKNICEHTCTTYTYMHHQIPPKNKICLVHHNKYMCHIHHQKHVMIHAPHIYTCTTKNICQHTCTTYTYMDNIHIHAPPNTTKMEDV